MVIRHGGRKVRKSAADLVIVRRAPERERTHRETPRSCNSLPDRTRRRILAGPAALGRSCTAARSQSGDAGRRVVTKRNPRIWKKVRQRARCSVGRDCRSKNAGRPHCQDRGRDHGADRHGRHPAPDRWRRHCETRDGRPNGQGRRCAFSAWTIGRSAR